MARRAAEELAEPKPTVREAMRMSEFADARRLAGENGLDRPIEWVRLMETPDIQPRTGDLLLTTGFPIKDDRAAQIRLVSRIAESGGAGLVVKPHPYLRKLAPEMLTEADRLNVPLFTIGADVQLVDIMAPLLERILNAEHWRLRQSFELPRRTMTSSRSWPSSRRRSCWPCRSRRSASWPRSRAASAASSWVTSCSAPTATTRPRSAAHAISATRSTAATS